jgi:uncharacterized protein (DUF1684 family)
VENRLERVVIETDRHRITGTLHLPKEGYRSRLSDYLNRGDTQFIPLVDAQMASLSGDNTEQHRFLAVSLRQVHIAYPLDEDD